MGSRVRIDPGIVEADYEITIHVNDVTASADVNPGILGGSHVYARVQASGTGFSGCYEAYEFGGYESGENVTHLVEDNDPDRLTNIDRSLHLRMTFQEHSTPCSFLIKVELYAEAAMTQSTGTVAIAADVVVTNITRIAGDAS